MSAREIAATCGVAALLVLGVGCAPQAPTNAPPVVVEVAQPRAYAVPVIPVAPPTPEPLRLAVVGDSITAWSPPFGGDPAQSWVYSATSNDMPLVGGWAIPGAKLAEMAAGVRYLDTDALVIMGGTNDLYYGTPIVDRLASIDAIAATYGARYTILAATAPYGFGWAAGVEWNATLAAHAEARGWHYVDPWAGVRQPDGSWYPTTDYGDGIHPNPVTAAYVGGVMVELIAEATR